MSARQSVRIATFVAIYDGRHYLGEVVGLANGQFTAFDADRKYIGTFAAKADAERAVLAQRRPS